MDRRNFLIGAGAACAAGSVSAQTVTVPVARQGTLATLQPGVTYAEIANGFARSHLMMDLIRPAGTMPVPAIVFVSGNGWRSIDRAALIPQLAPFARAGYLVATIDYRIIGEAAFPEPLKDVKAAIRFLRANAARYRIVAERIGIWGNSAGGQLAAMAGTTGTNPEFEDDRWAGQSSAVQAVAAWYGAFDLSELGEPNAPFNAGSAHMGFDVRDPANAERTRRANPQTYLSPSAPPFILVHGTEDRVVPIHQSERMVEALRAANVEARFVRVQGAGHSFGQVSSTPEVMVAMQDFFDAHLKR